MTSGVMMDVTEQAQRILSRQPVILDLETTGLGGADEIVEIVALDHDGRVLVQRLVRPQRPIPPRVTEVHGIGDADVANAPALPEIWPEVTRALQRRLVVTYNASFDRRLLHQTAARYQLPPAPCEWECLLTLYRRTLARAGRASLSAACRRHGIPTGQSHRALDDARAALALLYTLAAGG